MYLLICRDLVRVHACFVIIAPLLPRSFMDLRTFTFTRGNAYVHSALFPHFFPTNCSFFYCQMPCANQLWDFTQVKIFSWMLKLKVRLRNEKWNAGGLVGGILLYWMDLQRTGVVGRRVVGVMQFPPGDSSRLPLLAFHFRRPFRLHAWTWRRWNGIHHIYFLWSKSRSNQIPCTERQVVNSEDIK